MPFPRRYPHADRRNDLDNPSHILTVATRDLFNELDKNVKPVSPMQFWMVQMLFFMSLSFEKWGITFN